VAVDGSDRQLVHAPWDVPRDRVFTTIGVRLRRALARAERRSC
jgi:hypothetical protein